MRYTYLTIIILCVSQVFFAQVKQVTGKILNAENNSAVEFANIGVEGTYLGTATDFKGSFTIELSDNLADKTVRVSAVGFKPKKFYVSEWLHSDSVSIRLAPVNYGLSEVDVMAESRVAFGIVKTASNLISDNYPQESFGAKYAYSENGKSCNVNIFDKSGYKSRSKSDVFKNRNYAFDKEEEEGFELLKESISFMENVLVADIVRSSGNVLSIKSVDDFDIKIKEELLINEDSVWVISYNCNKPSIANTGDANVLRYSGEIIIKKTDHSIVSNKSTVVTRSNLIHGVSFANPDEDKEKRTYSINAEYKRDGDFYLLNSASFKDEEREISLQFESLIPFDQNVTSHQFYVSDLAK